MKSFIRWSATLGLIGSTLLGSFFAQPSQVFALPEADIVKVLQDVPVFTITDEQGGPLIAVVGDNQKVTQVFISQQDAQKFLAELQKSKPDLAKKVKVQPVPLSEVYKFAAANADKPDKLSFSLMPIQSQVELAKKLLTASGQEYQGGVPLFIARGGPQQAMLSIQQNNQEIVPMFFEKEQIQLIVDKMKKDQPDLASTMKIEVVSLERIISLLQQENDAKYKDIRLVPSNESIQFIQKEIQSQSNKNPQTAPAPAPATPPK